MRVAYIGVDDASDVSTWSGIPFHVLAALRNRGVELSLICPLKRDINKLLWGHKAWAKLRGQRIDHERFPVSLNSYARQAERRLRKLDVDLVFATSSIPVTQLQCTRPIVMYSDAVFHDMVGYYPESFTNTTLAAIDRGNTQEKAALANATFAVYASDWAAAGASQITDRSKVRVVPFGANLAVTPSQDDIEKLLARRCERIRQSCTLLFAGVDWRRKGGDIAINTVKILNERGIPAKLLIVGCHPPSPVPDFAECFGFISKKTSEGARLLQSLYERADLFLLPSRAEAAGIVLCEAAAFGLPVIATDTGGIGTYVQDGLNGFKVLLADNGAAFARIAESIIRSNEVYSQLSRSAFAAFTTRLNWGAAADSLIDIFKEALGQKASPSEHLDLPVVSLT